MKQPKPASARLAGQFNRAGDHLTGLEADDVGQLLAGAADLSLVLDINGKVIDIGFGSDSLAAEVGDRWLGKRFADLVSVDSQVKAQALLARQEVGAARWRQVNHTLPSGADLPMHYASQHLAARGKRPARVLLFGRDQRITAVLQQRLVEAQLSMERDYARFRQAELRYRHLFQVASEGVLVVDTGNGKVVEANPAAALLFNTAADRLVGQAFPQGFTPRGLKAVTALLATVRRTGRAEPVAAELAGNGQLLSVSATLFHQESSHLLLVRVVPANGQAPIERADAEAAMLLQLAQGAPDGLVVTDLDGNVLSANAEFIALCQMASAEQLRGQSLDRWLGRPGVDLGVLVSNLRQRGAVKLFATTLRGEFGAATEVEISAVMVAQAEPPLLGFTIRDVGRRMTSEVKAADALPRSVNQLTELVGRVPMKDIVGETTDLIERRCIEAALELTRDNRASAAEILGLSRQSLYVKLRRYGLGDLGPDAER